MVSPDFTATRTFLPSLVSKRTRVGLQCRQRAAVEQQRLLATGGEPYLLAAFPTYFTGGLWWLAYTVVGLALPLAGDWVYKKVREAFPLGGRWPKAG